MLEGLNTANLKEAIIHCQQQNISLSYSPIAARLQQALPQSQKLAIGERIFWQARTIGALLQVEQYVKRVVKSGSKKSLAQQKLSII